MQLWPSPIHLTAPLWRRGKKVRQIGKKKLIRARDACDASRAPVVIVGFYGSGGRIWSVEVGCSCSVKSLKSKNLKYMLV